jgi:hypothetical protein
VSVELAAGACGASPVRVPGSIRRTVTFDGERPDGPDGPIILVGHGRDLLTAIDGSAHVVAAATFRLEVRSQDGFTITHLVSDPSDPSLVAFDGRSARHGFRRLLAELSESTDRSVRMLRAMLLDVPITVNLSRLATLHRSTRRLRVHPDRAGAAGSGHPIDLCAGWVAGSQMRVASTAGHGALLHDGVAAPSLLRPDDPIAWHPLPPIAVDGYRRWRRCDVYPATGSMLDHRLDGLLRDSYFDGESERIEHEYTFALYVDATSRRIVACAATPHVLPADDCTNAVGSAARLIGTTLDEVGDVVRTTLVGAGACTHLSDSLGLLSGAGDLLEAGVD